MNNKSQLRKQLLRDRATISPVVWAQQSAQLCSLLKNFGPFDEGKTIASFFSYKQEPDLISLVDDRRWLFPHCAPGKALEWYPWQPGEALHQGKYGIMEPSAPINPIDATMIDVVLVPAVACDRDKYRLGYGGGYYDRFFSQIQTQKIIAIGVVFEQFCLDQVPRDPWDRPLDYVCTNSGVF